MENKSEQQKKKGLQKLGAGCLIAIIGIFSIFLAIFIICVVIVTQEEPTPTTKPKKEITQPTQPSVPQTKTPKVEKPVTAPPKVIIPSYRVLNEEIYDVPAKTQVEINIIVTGKITEAGLRALLNQIYSSTKQRRGFKYHDSPTAIYIFAYTSKERAESGTGQWIAMLQKAHAAAGPTIQINERQIAQISVKPEKRFGLSEETRMEIWKQIVLIESRSLDEAEVKYPYNIEKRGEYWERLQNRYEDDLAKKYGISRKHLQQISLEAIRKDWPVP